MCVWCVGAGEWVVVGVGGSSQCGCVVYVVKYSTPCPTPEEWSSMSKKLNEAVKAKYEEQVCLHVCMWAACL